MGVYFRYSTLLAQMWGQHGATTSVTFIQNRWSGAWIANEALFPTDQLYVLLCARKYRKQLNCRRGREEERKKTFFSENNIALLPKVTLCCCRFIIVFSRSERAFPTQVHDSSCFFFKESRECKIVRDDEKNHQTRKISTLSLSSSPVSSRWIRFLWHGIIEGTM